MCAISSTARCERSLVRLRRLRRAAHLADVLERGGPHLVLGCRRLEVVERLDVPAHAAHRSGSGLQTAVRPEQLEHVVVRDSRCDPALAPDDIRGRPERVEHGLLGRLDRRREELVERARRGDRRACLRPRARCAHRSRARGRSRRSRRIRPIPCARDRARTGGRRGSARAGPAACRSRRRRCSFRRRPRARPLRRGASRRGRRRRRRSRRTPKFASTRTPSVAPSSGSAATRRADAGLVAERDHPGACADGPLGRDRGGRGRRVRVRRRRARPGRRVPRESQPSSHSPTTGMTKFSTPIDGSAAMAARTAPS